MFYQWPNTILLKRTSYVSLLIMLVAFFISTPSYAYTVEKNYNVEFKQGHSTVRVFALRAYDIYLKNKKVCSYIANSTGSGFLLNYKGQFLTNNHVIEEDLNRRDIQKVCKTTGDRIVKTIDRLAIGWLDHKNIIFTVEASVLLASPELDMSVIAINTPGLLGSLEPVVLSSNYKRGSTVIASGFPAAFDNDRTVKANPLLFFTLNPKSQSGNRKIRNRLEADYLHESLTTGKITGFMKFKLQKLNYYVPMTEHSARISPGNSGGPLYNTDSEVIGINTLGSKYGKHKIGFASSSKTIMEFLKKTDISFNEPRRITDKEEQKRLQNKFKILDKAAKHPRASQNKVLIDPTINLDPSSASWEDLDLSAEDLKALQ